MNKGQVCSTSEYKYVGSLQITVMDDNAMCGEINKLRVSGVILLQSAPTDIPITLEK